MSNASMLRRIQYLEAQLAMRDRESAARESAARDVAAKISTEQRTAQRASEKDASEQAMRRAAWINHSITIAAPDKPFNVLAIESEIPADTSLWPPGFDKTLVIFETPTKTAQRPQLDDTVMGQMAKGKFR